jgi:hypothetical protein
MKAKIAGLAALVLGVLTAGCTSANAEVFGRNADRGAIIGGVLGGIIGNNSGNHNGAQGAAIGAASGLILGAIADQNEYRSRTPRDYSYESGAYTPDCSQPVVVHRYEHRPGNVVIIERRYWINGRLHIRHDRYWRSHSGYYHRR